ncbi:hypothetical protein [Cohnella thermotolerans]|uniref:hypothetical protein n=1 Tax=Cohnella thermotolerans TaxID=329858 RepID=UPI000404EDD0|nr:hypothetical protein [Cohnella thermotolerans]
MKNRVGGSASTAEPGKQEFYFYLDNKPYKQPLTLKIYSYPAYIRQSYSIRIW